MSKPISARSSKIQVMEYSPQTFDLGIPGVAMDLLERNKQGTRFVMNELSRIQTGVHQLEADSFEEKVSSQAMLRLKEIQESAYREAFELGLVEGKKHAFEEANLAIKAKIESFDVLLQSIQGMKKDLAAFNEAHLVQLTYHIGERLAGHEISVSPEATLEILRQAVQVAQSEEEITVRVSPDQLAFVEQMKAETGKELEFLKLAKLEADPSVGDGGCIINTNYGEIDSRFPERVSKLWDALKERLVRVKSELKSA